MTREYFINEINYWSDLIDFCNERYWFDFIDGLIESCDLDSAVCEDIKEACDHWTWDIIYQKLGDISGGYEYYIRNDLLEFSGLDDYDFDEYKDRVLEYADEQGEWDPEEEEEEDPILEDAEEDDEPPVEEEDFSVNQLMSMCSFTMASAIDNKAREEQEQNDDFVQLLNLDGNCVG